MEWAKGELMKVTSKIRKKLKKHMDDVNQMDYLKCVVKETLRLHPPAVLLRQETAASVKLGGFNIHPKTRVFFNAWAIQRDPE